jgi:hypothetical protein
VLNTAKTGRKRRVQFVGGLWAFAWVFLGTYVIFGAAGVPGRSARSGAVFTTPVRIVPALVTEPSLRTVGTRAIQDIRVGDRVLGDVPKG